ncbi:MAG TPA: sigma 54-interacting transcriptional regulator [Syntrophomonadaceae bacterium]|nr:sigma 54-interacting transcriptional regulator [Syntrophomonadaceae bacterium]
MRPLEHALSPIIKHRNIIAQTTNQADFILMEKIRQQKLDVIAQRINPSQADLVKAEVVESWIRSYNSGLDLYDYNYGPIMNKHVFKEHIRTKNLLIKSADPFIHQLETLLCDSECIILLTDEQGVMLRVVEGNKEMLEKQNARFHLVPGSIWTESTVGTCAHTITISDKTAIQICGPEHYGETYEHISCSSAPIFDTNLNLAGTLCLVTPSFHHQSPHSLALVVSMAWAVQKEFQLELKNSLISSTMEASDEAVVTINQKGTITHANIVAKSLFHEWHANLIGSNVYELLGEQPLIASVLNDKKPIIDAKIEIAKFDHQLNLRLAQPILDDYGASFGCVLIFRKINQGKTLLPTSNLGTSFAFSDIIGNSPEILECTERAQNFARLNANVLIQGESGTGKELYAQAIHNISRPGGPFVAVNCAAIPSTLIESELFGYEGGAFTGAQRQGRVGKIELANNGTLFLDEIGDMPIELQPVLLRVLEEKQVMRIGSNRYLPVDFRLLTATNNDLLELVEKGHFRQDLYYRLKVLEVNIPPLRHRGQDVILLAQHFIDKIARQESITPPILSDLTIICLLQYDWPGNARQLQNAMLHAVTMCSQNTITPGDLPLEITKKFKDSEKGNQSTELGEKLTMLDIERIMIINALEQSDNKVTEAAKLLKIGRSTLYRKMKLYKI